MRATLNDRAATLPSSIKRDQPVGLAALDDSDGVRLVVLVQTAVYELVLPNDVILSPEVRVGGPSAGLTVYDLLRSRWIVGTEVWYGVGAPLPMGGTAQEFEALIEAGYEALLAPELPADKAGAASVSRMKVCAVTTLGEALDVLREQPRVMRSGLSRAIVTIRTRSAQSPPRKYAR